MYYKKYKDEENFYEVTEYKVIRDIEKEGLAELKINKLLDIENKIYFCGDMPIVKKRTHGNKITRSFT